MRDVPFPSANIHRWSRCSRRSSSKLSEAPISTSLTAPRISTVGSSMTPCEAVWRYPGRWGLRCLRTGDCKGSSWTLNCHPIWITDILGNCRDDDWIMPHWFSLCTYLWTFVDGCTMNEHVIGWRVLIYTVVV
jgi:hypothetical protein